MAAGQMGHHASDVRFNRGRLIRIIRPREDVSRITPKLRILEKQIEDLRTGITPDRAIENRVPGTFRNNSRPWGTVRRIRACPGCLAVSPTNKNHGIRN